MGKIPASFSIMGGKLTWGRFLHFGKSCSQDNIVGQPLRPSIFGSTEGLFLFFPGTGEMPDIAEPQRVRGAVNPKVSLTYFDSSTPGQSPSKLQDDAGIKHSGE